MNSYIKILVHNVYKKIYGRMESKTNNSIEMVIVYGDEDMLSYILFFYFIKNLISFQDEKFIPKYHLLSGQHHLLNFNIENISLHFINN